MNDGGLFIFKSMLYYVSKTTYINNSFAWITFTKKIWDPIL